MTLPCNLNRFGGGKTKPYYCELEYLESSGNQYIDTLLSYKDSKYFDIETVLSFNVVNVRQEQGAYYGGYYGIQNTGYWMYGNQITTYAASANTWYKINLVGNQSNSNRVLTAIDLSTNISTEIGTISISNSNYIAYLFASNTSHDEGVSGSANLHLKAKIRYHKVKDLRTGELIQYFIPVLDWNMTPCMYEKISNKLFYNKGTGDFTYGRQIHYVDYLESTGTEYINTGFIPTIKTKTAEKTRMLSSGAKTPDFVRWTSAPEYDTFGTYLAGANIAVYYGNYRTGKSKSFAYTVGNDFELVNDITEIKFNNTTQAADRGSTDWTNTTYPLCLFAGNNSGSITFFADMRMYYYKIWDNGVLLRDYKPAVDENGVGFMFDRAERKIYDNAGTGAFKYPDISLEYLESTATQVIDTGVAIESDVSFDMDVQVLEAYSGYVPMGAYVNGVILLYQLYVNTQNQGLRMVSNGSNTTMTSIAASLDRHKIKINYSSMEYSIDGSDLSSIDGSFVDSTLTYTIFGRRVANGYDCYAKMRVYSLKMDKAGTTVRNYKPLLRNGTAGLLDTANDVFYTNLGTGTFSFKIKEKK